MSRKEFRVDGLAEPISHFTDAVSRWCPARFGIVAVDGNGGLVGGGRRRRADTPFSRTCGAVLARGRCGFQDVLKVTVFLTDIDDRPKINPLRQEFFGDTRPASTLVEVPRLAVDGAKVEIECVALVP